MGVFNENAGRMAISSITLSEPYHGAEKSAKVAQNLAVMEELNDVCLLAPPTYGPGQFQSSDRSGQSQRQ